MATGIVLPTGASVKIKDKTGNTYKTVKGFKSFSGIYGSAPSVQDVTDFDSTAKEKILGLPDEGQISLGFYYIPTDAGQQELVKARNAREVRTYVIQLGTAVGSKTWTFDAYALTVTPDGVVDTVMELAATLEVTGPITEGVSA